MTKEEVLAEFEAVKSVFCDLVDEPDEDFESTRRFIINVFPETGGVEVI